MSRRDRARALGEKKGAHTVCRISDLEEQGAWGSNILEHGLWDVRSKSLRGLAGLVGWICMSGCRVPCAKLVLLSDRLEFASRHYVSVVEGVRSPFFVARSMSFQMRNSDF